MKDTNGPFSRQSFLGSHAQDLIERCVVGISGLGGGGSHIAQQLAHVGVLNYILFDDDVIEESNLNRLVGGRQRDVEEKIAKVDIACRTIQAIRPKARVTTIKSMWQDQPEILSSCDIVFGCVDGLDQRRQLEAASRRHYIPLIDVGMDVQCASDGEYSVSGQVILSMPGCACMHCMGFLDAQGLAQEAAAYGAAGIHPQVVWSNGLLASVAVGLAVDLLTDWSRTLRGSVYLSHRGAPPSLSIDPMLSFSPVECPHYSPGNVGPPRLIPL